MKTSIKTLTADKSELWTPYKSAIGERQRTVLQALMYEGKNGATYKQLGKNLELHHGQISGLLSDLHKLGLVFIVRKKKDNCYLYVSHLYRDSYDDADVIDTPPQYNVAERRKLLEELFIKCLEIRANNNDFKTEAISDLLDQIIERSSPTDQVSAEKVTVKKSRRRGKTKKSHPSKGFHSGKVGKRLDLVQTTMSGAWEAGMKEVSASDLSVLSGVKLTDIYSSLDILEREGKVVSDKMSGTNKLKWRCAEVIK